jgi:hypothetical protein
MGLGSSLFNQKSGEVPRVIVCAIIRLETGPDPGSKYPQLDSWIYEGTSGREVGSSAHA